jgi:hypothetical protein
MRTVTVADRVIHPSFEPNQQDNVLNPTEKVQSRIYQRESLLFTQGSKASAVLVVIRGRVKIQIAEDQKEQFCICVVGKGAMLGVPEALSGRPYGVTAIALDRVTAISIPTATLLDQMQLLPHFRSHILVVLSHYLQRLHKAISCASYSPKEYAPVRSVGKNYRGKHWSPAAPIQKETPSPVIQLNIAPEPTPKILNSWKQIAQHLHRGIRTVQRWEQTAGMPVRRIGHGPKAPVIALSTELDYWLRTQTLGPLHKDRIKRQKPTGAYREKFQ